MSDEQADADLVGQFYEAAADDSIWPTVADALRQRFRATSAVFYLEQPQGPGLLTTPGWSEQALRAYTEYYHEIDPFAGFARYIQGTRVLLGQEMVDQKAFLEMAIWQDFGRVYCDQAMYFMCAMSPLDERAGLRVGLHRPRGEQAFCEDDRAKMLHLLPHLRRALQLRTRLLREQGQAVVRGAALDGLSTGLIVLDDSTSVLFANQTAEALCRDGTLRFGGAIRGLRVVSAAENARLEQLVHDVINGGSGGPIRVTRAAGPPLALLVSRLPGAPRTRAPRHGSARHAVLVLIRDLAASPVDSAMLKQLFGFSATEALVAEGIALGESAEDIAARRDRSVLTVRSQIRSILGKTGAVNLRDLMRLLTGFPG